MGACDRCPLQQLSGGCSLELVPCASCGYHALPEELLEPRGIDLASISPAVPSACGSTGGTHQPLTELSAGAQARVARVDCGDEAVNRRLLAYGLAPGARVELLQRRPAFIVRVYETELALAADVAGGIGVTVAPAGAQGI